MEEADIKSKTLADLLQLFDRGLLTKRQLAEYLTERDIVLFSDEELENLPDEFEETPENVDELFTSNRN